MERINLGLIAGRHEIPGISGYILQEVKDPTDMDAINDAVTASLENIFKDHVHIVSGQPINSADTSDMQMFRSDLGLNLYVTGLTAAALSVAGFCAYNGIPLRAYHYNRETGEYVGQVIFAE